MLTMLHLRPVLQPAVTDCVLVPDFPEKLHIVGTIQCYCSTPQGVFVLVKGSQVWSEPRAISVVSSTFFERGMLI